jgi:hypothetical protein
MRQVEGNQLSAYIMNTQGEQWVIICKFFALLAQATRCVDSLYVKFFNILVVRKFGHLLTPYRGIGVAPREQAATLAPSFL